MSKRAEQAALKVYPPTHPEGKRHAKRVQSELIDTHQPVRTIFQKGYSLAEKDLGWHSVDESLPPIDEEVIVLTDEMHGKKLSSACHISYGHRPNPEGWDGKDIFTGKVTHHDVVTYDGWNIPGVRYWMPCPPIPDERSCQTCTNDNGCVTCVDGELWEGEPIPSEKCEDIEKTPLKKCEEVDLEKEIDKTVNECTDGYNFDWDKFAKHFYEIGKKDMKEQMMKEVKLTWQEIGLIVTINRLMLQDPAWAIQLIDKDGEKYYTEILRRYNIIKEKSDD